MSWQVVPITKRQAEAVVTARHYSRRACIFWAGFGLVIDGMIEGVVVYGQPSPQLFKHAFKDRDFRLYELSRLVVQTSKPNAASFLVGRSLQMLEKPSAVVSYADSQWGHVGAIYQATNWLYTGATKSHDHLYLVDGQRLHPMTLRDQGILDPKRWARENGISTIEPEEKHRYFFLLGSKRDRRRMRSTLRYPVQPYPKADQQRYDDGEYVPVPVADVAAAGAGMLA
jgi:hypothetical protein